MYKKAISIISILLIIILFINSTIIPVSALDTFEENTSVVSEVMPRFTTIANLTTAFSINGVNSTSTATLISQISTNLKIVIELQKKKSGTYETIETWTKTGTGDTLVLEKTRLINVLSDYRIRVTYTAGSESTTVYKYPA